MKSSLNTDELAAIFALKNLTSTINKTDVEAAYLLKKQSLSSINNSSDDDNVEDDDDEEEEDSDGDSDVCDEYLDNSNDIESEGNGDSGAISFDNSHIKNVDTYIQETVGKIRIVCPDAIMNILDSQLDEIIRRVCMRSLTSPSFLRNIMTDFVDPHLKFLTESADKQFLFKIEILLKATVVYFHSLQNLVIDDEMETVEELLKEYSSHLLFLECREDPAEAQYVLNFRNMKKALCIIPAKRNKMLLINICALLEGSRRIYITGGTQSSATTRRTIIYEHESGLKRKCRPERRRKIPKVVKKQVVSKQMITCSCGAYILKRTMWKHSRSKKHTKPAPSRRLLLSLPSGVPNGNIKSEQPQSPPELLTSSSSSAAQPLPNQVPVPAASPSAAPAAKRQRQSNLRKSMPPPTQFQNPLPVVPNHFTQPQHFQPHMQMPPVFSMFPPLVHGVPQFMQPLMTQTSTSQFIVHQPQSGYGGGYFLPMSLPSTAMTAGSTGPRVVGFFRIDTSYVYPTQPSPTESFVAT